MLATFTHSHRNIHILMAPAAMQDTDLLIRSDTAGFIQRTSRYFYAQPFQLILTLSA